MAGYLDDSFLAPAKREPINAVVVYTPRRKRKSYKASLGGNMPAVQTSPSYGGVSTPRPRKQRAYKASLASGPQTQTGTPSQPTPSAPTVDEAAFREKAKAIGQWNEKRRAKERRLEESQFQKQLRREAALAKRKQRARKQSIRKHKRIARKMWRRLI